MCCYFIFYAVYNLEKFDKIYTSQKEKKTFFWR